MTDVMIYVEAMAMCLILELILFFFNRSRWTTLRQPLAICYILAMASCLADVVWKLVDGNVRLISLNHLSCIVELCAWGIIGYFWFAYCHKRIYGRMWMSKQQAIWISIPAIVAVLATLSSPWTYLFFYVDEMGYYHRGRFNLVLLAIGFAYIVGATIISIRGRMKAQTTRERKMMSSLLFFGIPPMIMAGLQNILPTGLPAINCGLLVSILVHFIITQETEISIDRLTDMPNRMAFERFAVEKISHCKNNEKSFALIFSDVDDFKMVNDTYGHLAGDRALKYIATVIKKVTQQYDGFCCRFGGDEFGIIVDETSKEQLANIYHEMNRLLEEQTESEDFFLCISAGSCIFDGNMSLNEMIDKADKNCYLEKKSKKK